MKNEFKKIITDTENCINCQGDGEDCKKGFAWIYCIHLKNDVMDGGTDGEISGCNFFSHKNLCDTCKDCFASCVSSPIFGNGEGNDNVISCVDYKFANKRL
jgi:hypothetical protein